MDKLLTKLKTKKFPISENALNENEIISKGYLHLSGTELLSRISNKIVFGKYPMDYKFVAEIYENGNTKGINNFGTSDSGNWSINLKKHTLHLKWKNSWLDTLTRAYNINGNIVFFDVDTGNWRTTFNIIENLT